MVAAETSQDAGSPGLADRLLVSPIEQTVYLTCTPTQPGAPPVPGDALKVGNMRRVGRALLHQWGCSRLGPTAEVLISELMTNALVHGCGTRVKFTMSLTESTVRIEVDDGSSAGSPRLVHPRPHQESGRGLFLVEALAAEWGVVPETSTTWCTLALPGVGQ
ncbi:ATP-binding protein [Streptomyces sp. WZ.A104]|uniref:ATP-binding protein n=1 Tax=Streptomyces sp. WZ.A104 TaxID=2023771 RepID=UPI0015CCF8F7|nr:ATP-binding protein [Streptomyces sp. WZ.A104]